MGLLLHVDTSATTPSDAIFATGIAASILLTALSTLWYFASPDLTPSPRSGLLFGLTSVGVGLVLDVGVISVAEIGGGIQLDTSAYYADVHFWIGVLTTLITTTIAGYIRGMRVK